MTVYLEDWAEGGEAEMLRDFEAPDDALKGKTVLVAVYAYGCYEGDAYVLLRDNATGAFEEVHGGHCSCYGLEGQWQPETADPDAILHRIDKGTWGTEAEVADYVRAALTGTPTRIHSEGDR